MTPVKIFSMPHNFRCALYRPGDAPDTFGDPAYTPAMGEFVDLPIPMPTCLMLTTHNGQVVAARADGHRIKWADLDTVLRGVQQYNRDLASHDPDTGRCRLSSGRD
jgi:hypothetical protein